MTLTLKIKNAGPVCYAARILRGGTDIARIEPGQEVDVVTWDGEPLSIVEAPAAAVTPPAGAS